MTENQTNVFQTKIKTKKGKIYLGFMIAYWIFTAVWYFSKTYVVFGSKWKRPGWVWPLYLGVAAFMAFCIIFCFYKWSHVFRKRDERGREIKAGVKPWHYIVFAVFSIYGFLAMELINNSDMLASMAPLHVFMNIAGAMIMTMLFYMFINSFRKAVIFIVCLSTVMALIFYYVYLTRGEPLQLIDIYSFATAMGVAGDYEFIMTRWIVVFVTATLCIIPFVMHWKDWAPAQTFRKKILMRVGAVIFMIAAYFAYMGLNWNGEAGITVNLWKPHKTYEKYGTNVGFFALAKFMKIKPPEGYSLQKVEQTADESRKEFETFDEEPLSSSEVQPVNIIVIMNESWADYSICGDLNTNEEVMPYYHSMSENTIKGYNLVCITGGGTAKTEYEFLTGNSVKQYPGRVPYVSWFTTDQYSMVSTLKDQGYTCMAMHPNLGTNWNRVNAYAKYGFEKFYTIADFDEDAEKVRDYISDKANYEKIIEVVEEKENPDDRLFMFDVTMQNHGGYKDADYEDTIWVEDYTNSKVNQFLSLENESDKALRYLIEYFEDCDQPTMIVMFGDHFPKLDESFEVYLSGDKKDNLPLEEARKYYSTPFFIWTNYDIEEQSDMLTSTNFLGNIMLRLANVELTDYDNFHTMMMEKIRALNHQGYVNAEGEMVSWDNAPEDVLEKENDYECLQYNDLTGTKKCIKDFFSLKKENNE